MDRGITCSPTGTLQEKHLLRIDTAELVAIAVKREYVHDEDFLTDLRCDDATGKNSVLGLIDDAFHELPAEIQTLSHLRVVIKMMEDEALDFGAKSITQVLHLAHDMRKRLVTHGKVEPNYTVIRSLQATMSNGTA